MHSECALILYLVPRWVGTLHHHCHLSFAAELTADTTGLVATLEYAETGLAGGVAAEDGLRHAEW